MKSSYEIVRTSGEASDGWRLCLIEDNAIVAEVRFSIGNYCDINDALRSAYLDAELEAQDWINSKKIMEVHPSRPLVILALAALPLLVATLFFILLVPTVSNIFGEILHIK